MTSVTNAPTAGCAPFIAVNDNVMNASYDFPAFFRQVGLRPDGNSVIVMALLTFGALLLAARHPLRRELSESFDFLVTRRLPLWITVLALGLEMLWGNGTRDPAESAGKLAMPAALSGVADARVNARPLVDALLAKAGHPSTNAALETGDEALQAVAGPVAKSLTLRALSLLHGAIRPLPLAVLLPVWLVMATVSIGRYPYRYQRERLCPEQRTMLWVASVLTMVWSGVYLFSFSRTPVTRAELEAVMQPATVLVAAMAAAAYQVWLARSVIQWAEPTREQMSARDETIARWQNVLWLAAFNGAWTALWLWMDGADADWLSWSVLAEILFAFGPLPVAIAVADRRATLATAGGAALRMLWRSWVRLLAWTFTAVLFLAVGEMAVELSGDWDANAALHLGGRADIGHTLQMVTGILLRGLLHAWLVPAAMLVVWRTAAARQENGGEAGY